MQIGFDFPRDSSLIKSPFSFFHFGICSGPLFSLQFSSNVFNILNSFTCQKFLWGLGSRLNNCQIQKGSRFQRVSNTNYSPLLHGPSTKYMQKVNSPGQETVLIISKFEFFSFHHFVIYIFKNPLITTSLLFVTSNAFSTKLLHFQ